jgi:hypothetical protein
MQQSNCNVNVTFDILNNEQVIYIQHELIYTVINIKLIGTCAIMTNKSYITTKFGNIEVEFYSDIAPKTVENFKKLARSRFYDGLIFHRIVPGFVIQGGDPYTRDNVDRTKWGTGGPGWTIKAEFNKISILVAQYLWQDHKIQIVRNHNFL